MRIVHMYFVDRLCAHMLHLCLLLAYFSNIFYVQWPQACPSFNNGGSRGVRPGQGVWGRTFSEA